MSFPKDKIYNEELVNSICYNLKYLVKLYNNVSKDSIDISHILSMYRLLMDRSIVYDSEIDEVTQQFLNSDISKKEEKIKA